MSWSSFIHARGRLLAIIHDVCMIPIAWFGAFWLRFNLDGIPEYALSTAFALFPFVIAVQTAAYWSLGLYRGIWQFASLPDLMRIFKAACFGALSSIIICFLLMRLEGFPRSVFPIYTMLLILFLGGARFFVRWLKDYKKRMAAGQRVLIIGAGTAGEGLVRDLLRDKQPNFKPVAFIDDKISRKGQDIHGVRVVGRYKDIPKIVEKYNIELIIIALPEASAQEMRKIMSLCEGSKCRVRTLPSLNDLVSGRVTLDLLREVSLEDLLGRDPVKLDWAAIGNAIHNKVVLVTGGGGSIGSELCRQIARLQPQKLIVIERSEFNLFNLEQEFQQSFPNITKRYHLVDVNDRIAVHEIMHRSKPDIVFHAAAYKHVPMLELQPREAIVNNILGTRTMVETAVAAKVKYFVLVSTDKAVNPTNIMGATKRASEMVCHYYHGFEQNQGKNERFQTEHNQTESNQTEINQTQSEYQKTIFITVRFGNVLGSAGSVVPIFRSQIEKGGPVTVTDPEVTRYFMTIPEACQLILQALSIGKGGEIFVLDMGEPIKIQYLAEQMIRLAGKKLGEDIEIEYTGLRSGEKLFEELFHPDEALTATQHEKIFQAKARMVDSAKFMDILGGLEQAAAHYDQTRLFTLLNELVPELNTHQQNIYTFS